MSFLDDIIDVGAAIVGVVSGWGVVGTIVETAAAGWALNKVVNSVSPQPANNSPGSTSAATVDPGVRQQIDASTANSIPVVYGNAILGGRIFDAYMTGDNKTMYFAIAICEATDNTYGNVQFNNVYLNGQQCVFGFGSSDWGVVTALYDPSSQTSTSLLDSSGTPLYKVYLYNRGSRAPCITRAQWYGGATNGDGNGQPAWNIMPNWGTAHTADELVFAIVEVTYNKTVGVTGLGTLQFDVSNPIYRPGDALKDYMINARYGAGINSTTITV
jgi:hypothetical protein